MKFLRVIIVIVTFVAVYYATLPLFVPAVVDPSKAEFYRLPKSGLKPLLKLENMAEGVTYEVDYVYFTSSGVPYVYNDATIYRAGRCLGLGTSCRSLITRTASGRYVVKLRGIDRPDSPLFYTGGAMKAGGVPDYASEVWIEKEERK